MDFESFKNPIINFQHYLVSVPDGRICFEFSYTDLDNVIGNRSPMKIYDMLLRIVSLVKDWTMPELLMGYQPKKYDYLLDNGKTIHNRANLSTSIIVKWFYTGLVSETEKNLRSFVSILQNFIRDAKLPLQLERIYFS